MCNPGQMAFAFWRVLTSRPPLVELIAIRAAKTPANGLEYTNGTSKSVVQRPSSKHPQTILPWCKVTQESGKMQAHLQAAGCQRAMTLQA